MTDKVLEPDELAAAALVEVQEFHAFLAEWFSGRAENSPDLADLSRRFAPDLQYISPSGVVLDEAKIEELLAGSHGEVPTIAIEVRNLAVRYVDTQSVLVTYEEHQTGLEPENSRITTVLFVPKTDAPNGVAWMHVHEVWMAQE